MNFAKSKKLNSIPGIVHGFANKNVGTDTSKIERQYNVSYVAQLKQIHSGDVIILDDIESHDNNREGDALITSLSGVVIGIRTADCVPILISDKDSSVIAAVHAGWRGTHSQIAANAVKAIESEFGISSKNLTAAIGPSIKSDCYEVGEDVASLFKAGFGDTDSYLTVCNNSKYMLDLALANRVQLQDAGVGEIEVLDICTKCDNRFNSYRREGKGVNTQLSFIALA